MIPVKRFHMSSRCEPRAGCFGFAWGGRAFDPKTHGPVVAEEPLGSDTRVELVPRAGGAWTFMFA